jgi:alpha-L-fucosidase
MQKWIVSILMLLSLQLYAQEPTKMQWFSDAKLGIFIHWGIYAVYGTSESWAFYNKRVPYTNYMNQIKGFTAANYKPTEWANLIAESGAKYAVITTKHHDGVALWNTKQNQLSIPKKSPAAKDVLTPFYEALKAKQIKFGAYYSLIDWSHPAYTGFTKDSSRYKVAVDTIRWKGFQGFYKGQLTELIKQYHPDLFWFDGDWEHDANTWDAAGIRKMILDDNPKAIINGRLQGFGDYDTPEQNFPVSRPLQNNWELCLTTNDNWGFRFIDTNFKTPYEIISIFADCIGMGGNLLLDIGPKADGSIPKEQVHLLKELGAWNKKHEEAIFSTIAGLPAGHFYGPSTLSKDSQTLYLFVANSHATACYVKGLQNKIVSAEVLGNHENITAKVVGKIAWSQVPGLVYFDIPSAAQDPYMTVLKLKLDGPLKLYRGKGGL